MALPNLYDLVGEVNTGTDYWFVRTDSGTYFETYLQNGFVGIGWNYITLEDLTKSDVDVKEKIGRFEKLDLEDSNNKRLVTTIYTKLLRFKNLAKGDRIVIPSAASGQFAFGTIEDKNPYVDADQSFDCEYYKRRRVRWGVVKFIEDLDPNFYKIKMSRHAISSVKENGWLIDKVLESLFVKDGRSHFVLNILKEDPIQLATLTNLVSSITTLSNNINAHFDLGESPDTSAIRLQLQSPGTIEIILEKGKSLIILAAVLSIISCGGSDDHLRIPQGEKDQINDFINLNSHEIDSIRNSMEALEVNKDKINSF